MALINKVFLLKKQIKKDFDKLKKPLPATMFIPHFSLFDLKGTKYSSQEIIANPLTLVVFFSPTDCSSCLFEKELWKAIAETKEIAIIGIARHNDKRELNDWIENSDIHFPVFLDEKGEIARLFGIKRTPLKLLVDHEGKVLLIDSVRITSSEQKAFIKELENVLPR